MWFEIWHFTHLRLALLEFHNPPMAFPLKKKKKTFNIKYNIKQIKKLGFEDNFLSLLYLMQGTHGQNFIKWFILFSIYGLWVSQDDIWANFYKPLWNIHWKLMLVIHIACVFRMSLIFWSKKKKKKTESIIIMIGF